MRHQRSDDGFDLAGNDVAAGEFGVAKDGSEDPLGQEVLDQHLLDSGFGEVGVDRLTAFLMEGGKGSGKLTVRAPFLFDQFCQAVPKRGHPIFELCNCFFPFGILLRAVGKEGFEGMYQLCRIGQIGIERLLIVLPKDGAVWGLEEDVVAGVAFFKLVEHFGR